MSNGMQKTIRVGLSLFLIVLTSLEQVWACPFCDAPSTTLSEQLETADAAALVKWISAQKPDPNDFAEGTTTFEVIESAGKKKAEIRPGQQFTVKRYHSGTPGEESLFFASRAEEETELNWGLPTPVTRECWKYMVGAPSREAMPAQRLTYYLKFLEHPDFDIAMDAYGEFAGSPYEHLKAIAADLPRQQIIVWLNDPLTVPTRRGLYGLMLGLCGTPLDALSLQEIIRQQPEETRMGIDGIMAGYLLLTGQPGMQQLTTLKLDDPATPEHEIYPILKTLDFMWTYGNDRVEKETLKRTLRRMVKYPQLTGLVVLNLARWQDWEAMEQLAANYGQEPFADRYSRHSVIRYLLIAETDAPAGETNGGTNYRDKAKSHLEHIRQIDPANVKYVMQNALD